MLWPSFREPVSAWTHLFWFLLALPAVWYLWRRTPSRPLEQFSVRVFGVGLLFCSGSSWLFHSVPAELMVPFRTTDHIGIYLLIAGTVTPIGLLVLSGWWRFALVGGIWILAFLGIGLRLTSELTTEALTVLYLFMGWIGCLTYLELARRLSHAGMRPLWLGGLFYSGGALLNRLQWPILLPGLIEAHEVFHLLVILGSASHYWFLLSVVVPYRQKARARLSQMKDRRTGEPQGEQPMGPREAALCRGDS